MAKIADLTEVVDWRKIAETIAGANVTTLSLAGLNLPITKAYRLLISWKNVDVAMARFRLFFNADTDNTNYYRTGIYKSNGGAIGQFYNNHAILGEPGAGQVEVVEGPLVCDVDGRVRYFAHTHAWDGASLVLEESTILYNVIVASITQIDLTCDTPNMIGAGSRMVLFAMEK
jgi:hypothetical protein